jgi:hypothetical protein
MKSLCIHNEISRLITQVASSNLARATNKIKHLACLKKPSSEGFFVCDESCDVTEGDLRRCDLWVRVD